MNFSFIESAFDPVFGRGTAPTPAQFQNGSRRDVAHLLEATGAIAYSDAFLLLAQAWLADRVRARFPDPHEAKVSDREIEALIQDLCVSPNFEVVTNPTMLAGLYLAGEMRVAGCLVKALRHPRSSHRQRAAQLCEALSDPRCLEALGQVGDSDHPDAVTASLRTVCRLGDATHLPQIERALLHSNEYLSVQAIAAIRRLQPPSTVELLMKAVKKGRPLVCVTALTAMGELGDLTLLPRLMEELDSEKSFHRIGAARGLTALAVRCPDGNFTPVLEALQKKARLGGVEYRRALDAIRKAIGIDPELPIPAQGGDASPASLPIPGSADDFAVFEAGSTALPLDKAPEEDAKTDDGSLSRRLKNMLPRPEDWEYD